MIADFPRIVVPIDLIVEHTGPVLVVGPAVTRPKHSLRGQLVVAVDGSSVDGAVLGVAADWAPRLGQQPWVITVVDNDVRTTTMCRTTRHPVSSPTVSRRQRASRGV